MAVELSNISMPMAALLASLIGASATITAAILNLRMAWKRELLARAQHKPVTRKSSRAPVIPLMVLLLASAAGGFALSYYLEDKERTHVAMLEAELGRKIEQLSVATGRIETVNLNGAALIAQQVRDEERRKRGMEGVVAGVVLEKCVAPDTAAEACDESTAHAVRLCTEIPADAALVAIDLYARREGDARPWRESRVLPGDDFGNGRFVDHTTVPLADDMHRQVCQELLYWNADHPLDARMVVHYDTFPLVTDPGRQQPGEPDYLSHDRALSQVP